MKLFFKILFFILAIFQVNICVAKAFDFDKVISEITHSNILYSEKSNCEFQDVFLENDFAKTCKFEKYLLAFKSLVKSRKATAAKGVGTELNVLSKSQTLRIENAATRINKPITVVGSRASGKAGAYSDWDYVIEGLNSKNWSKIKNSLPGSRSILDNTPRNIDIFKGPVNPNLPYITIYPR
jgi:hypothetical protein